MEGIKPNVPETSAEGPIAVNEGLNLSGKVIRQLVLWGMLAISPMLTQKAEAGNVAHDKGMSIAAQAVANESIFRTEGFTSLERKDNLPVVVFVCEQDLAGNVPDNSDEYKFSKVLSNGLEIAFVDDEHRVAERNIANLQGIIHEALLAYEGFIKTGQETKLGKWISADYYVVSSVKKVGDNYELKNSVVDLKTGESAEVLFVSPKGYSKDSVASMKEMIKKAIEKLQSKHKDE